MDPHNPNHKIFKIPTEEGFSEEDKTTSMIGDAVMKHISDLSHFDRQAYEYYDCTSRGNLFTYPPSLQFNDDFMKEEEALLEEEEISKVSQDIWEHGTRICYEDWANHPGMSFHFDIPSSPRDIPYFSGNIEQNFYDIFPEKHPDAIVINNVIKLLQKYPYSDGYMDFVIYCVDKLPFVKEYTFKHIITAIKNLTDDSDEEEIELCIYNLLSQLDLEWAKEYRQKVFNENKSISQAQNKIETLREELPLLDKTQQAARIAALGKELYLNHKGEMTVSLWEKYKKLKKDICSPLIINRCDINTARPSEIQQALGIKKSKACEIWTERPYKSLPDLYNKAKLDKTIFVTGKISGQVLDLIDKACAIAFSRRDKSILETIAFKISQKKLIQNDIDNDEWDKIWNYYKVQKYNLVKNIRQAE